MNVAVVCSRIVKQEQLNAGEPSGNWCLDPTTGALLWGWRISPPENFWYCISNILQSSVFWAGTWFAMPSIMRS